MNDLSQQAQAYYNAGNYQQSLTLAREAMQQSPDDVEMLRLAAISSHALGQDDAAGLLRRLLSVRPDDVDGWRDLADALTEMGDSAGALDALRQVVRLGPDDLSAQIDLGHTLFATGARDDAIATLVRTAEQAPGNLAVLRSLIDMYRMSGQQRAALETARQLLRWRPDDVMALVDAAELSLALGQADEAADSLVKLRAAAQEPEDEVYAIHALIQAEIERGHWRRALDIAVDATRLDRSDITTDLLAYIVANVFGGSDQPVKTRAELDAAIAAERAELRRRQQDALLQ
jgi:tetratricopeptide (TPR) repeat protein